MTLPALPVRPCGACTALVSAISGCPHWRPQLSAAQAVSLERKARVAEGRTGASTGRPRGTRIPL